MEESFEQQGLTTTDLSSPLAYFCCGTCYQQDFTYPTLLTHHCVQTVRADEVPNTAARLAQANPVHQHVPFKSSISIPQLLRFEIDEVRAKRTQRLLNLINAAGDAVPQTIEELHKHRGRFTCVECFISGRALLLHEYSFLESIEHTMTASCRCYTIDDDCHHGMPSHHEFMYITEEGVKTWMPPPREKSPEGSSNAEHWE